MYSKTISVHPAIVLLAAPAGGAIAGFVGMILIVPVIAMIQQTWRTVIHLFEGESGDTPAVAASPPPAPSEAALRVPPMEGPASAPASGG